MGFGLGKKKAAVAPGSNGGVFVKKFGRFSA